METSGIETIQGLTGTPPMSIEVSYNTIKAGELLRQVWNKKFLAFIPYCYVCKVPVNWIIDPPEEVILRCPDCKREWTRDEFWTKDLEKDKKHD